LKNFHITSEKLTNNHKQFSKQEIYILHHNERSVFHSIHFAKIIKAEYDINSFLVTFYKNDEICGVLILYKCPILPFGFKLTDLIFSGSYGGLLCDDSVPKATFIQLLQQKYGVSSQIELKLSKNNLHSIADNKIFYVNYKLDLLESIDEIWLYKVDQKARNQVRKSNKSGLKFSLNGDKCLDEFYEVYKKTMKGLGSPNLSYNFFKQISIVFSQDIKISIVKYNNIPVSALFNIIASKKIHNVWAGSLFEYRKYCPNYMNYWELIKWSKEHNINEFDFGRSIVDSPHENFKKQWGAEKTELFYFDLLTNGHSKVINPKSDAVLLFSSIWRILPYKITSLLNRFFVKRTG